MGYDAKEAYNWLRGIGPGDIEGAPVSSARAGVGPPNGRLIYGVTELTLDMVFPVLYGLLLTLLLIGAARSRPNPRNPRLLLALPLLAGGLDILENLALATLALETGNRFQSLVLPASVLTSAKTVLLGLTVGDAADHRKAA